MRILLIVLLLGLVQCATQSEFPSKEKKVPEKVSIDRSKIKKTIASHRGYMSQCYGKALLGKGSANLSGTLFVSFTIGPDGKATAPRVIPEKSSIQNDVLAQCLFAGITSWDFPVHPEGLDMDIRYPFVFSDRPPTGMQKTMDKFEKLRTR